MIRLSVISPTFNEAENIPKLVEQVGLALGNIDYELLVVDDNSPDLTWSTAERIALANPRVRVLRRMQNPGLAAAVIDGFSAAQGDVLACIDADLQHDPRILPEMLAELYQGSTVVVGSRYVDGGATANWNWQRRFASWTATKMARILVGIKLTDPMSGYFLMRRQDFTNVQARLDGQGFKILLEILAKLQPSSVKEIPYTFSPRTLGKSKLSSKVVVQYLRQLWRLSPASQLVSDRFLKFAVVGAIGVLVNLLAMALLLRVTTLHDWRASAAASLTANIHNYILNNMWSFADRTHSGLRALKGYLSYLAMSALGLGVTTGAYAGLYWGLTRLLILQSGTERFASLSRLSCQLIAVLVGTYFNYELNKAITWPEAMRPNLRVPGQGCRSISSD